jgi:hypothetical protein
MSHVYPLAKQSFLSGALNLTSINLKVALIDSTYTYSSSHQYVSSLTGIIARSSTNLGSVTVTNGQFNAGNITITAVPSGHTIAQLAIYHDTGTDGTSDLILLDDGLSATTNGGDVTVSWQSPIFSL